MEEIDIDYKKWEKVYENPATEEKLFADYQKVEDYDLDLIPSIVIEEEKIVKGALRPKLIANELNKIN